MRIGRRSIPLSNPDKEHFPHDGITKTELDYYRTVTSTPQQTTSHRPMGRPATRRLLTGLGPAAR
ncbi:hypothetical protein [Streptomyces sp. NPDC003393]